LPGKLLNQFINLVTGLDLAVVGHKLRSCTHEVQAFSIPHPVDSNRNVVFVDTPGFNDTNTKDADILQAIAEWLETT
jgi:GTPase Era involved in 16S rRNA processing